MLLKVGAGRIVPNMTYKNKYVNSNPSALNKTEGYKQYSQKHYNYEH